MVILSSKRATELHYCQYSPKPSCCVSKWHGGVDAVGCCTDAQHELRSTGCTSMGGQYPESWYCQEAQLWHVWATKDKRPGAPWSISPLQHWSCWLTAPGSCCSCVAQEPRSLGCGGVWEWGLYWLKIAAWQKISNIYKDENKMCKWYFEEVRYPTFLYVSSYCSYTQYCTAPSNLTPKLLLTKNYCYVNM